MTISTDLEKFLMSCIDNTDDAGIIQWSKVAGDCGISSGGASNKFRALKKEWEAMKGGNGTAAASSSATTTGIAVPVTPQRGRKRKTDHDEAEATPKAPKTPKTRRARKTTVEKKVTKKDEDSDDAGTVSDLDAQD